jgi:WD40 repeat protein
VTYDVDHSSRSKSTIASAAPIDQTGRTLLLHSSSTALPSVTKLLNERKRGALEKIRYFFRRTTPVAPETQQTNSPLKTTWSITSLAFSPDKQMLSVGTDSGKLWVEDVSNSPNPRWALQLDGTIGSAQFSADSSKLIVAAGSAAYIFNTADGESLRHISQQGDEFAAVTFASDGKRAAAGTLKGTVNILDLSTPSPAKLAERFENWLSSATPAADAKISGLQSVYALQFPSEGSVNRRLSATPVLAVWTNNERLLAPADEQERDKTLALEHHDFNVDGRIKGICSGLRQDLTVPPDLDYRSVCDQK